MSTSKKREAQSPLAGDDEDLKRRIIEDKTPILVKLDEIPDDDEEPAGSELTILCKLEGERESEAEKNVSDKVESLIGRMDRFMDCFATLHSQVSKNQRSNDRKFKGLETAHNTLATRVSQTTAYTLSRIDSLETQLQESISANSKLQRRVEKLEEEQKSNTLRQAHINDEQSRTAINHSRKLNSLEIEQGYINKNVYDCSSEIKERKIIITGVKEQSGENVAATALSCINKVISTAIALKQNEPHGLKKLHTHDIDNVFRLGKASRGNQKRNICLTFIRMQDKEMVFRAKGELKDDKEIKFFINDDVQTDGRRMKARMRQIVAAAVDQGVNAKLSGNKVIIGSRAYFSNELSLYNTKCNRRSSETRERHW